MCFFFWFKSAYTHKIANYPVIPKFPSFLIAWVSMYVLSYYVLAKICLHEKLKISNKSCLDQRTFRLWLYNTVAKLADYALEHSPLIKSKFNLNDKNKEIHRHPFRSGKLRRLCMYYCWWLHSCRKMYLHFLVEQIFLNRLCRKGYFLVFIAHDAHKWYQHIFQKKQKTNIGIIKVM